MRRKLFITLVLLCLSAAPVCAQFTEPYATDKAFPVTLVDATDGYSPVTGKAFGDTTVTYSNITDGTTVSAYTDDASTWAALGVTGNYKLTMGASEFALAGKRYTVWITVAGCRNASFWVDTRRIDPNLLPDEAHIYDFFEPNLPDSTDIEARVQGGMTTQGYTTARGALLANLANIGTAFSVDGSASTLFGILAKLFDDNAGATYDPATDSLNAIVDVAIAGVKAVTDDLNTMIEADGAVYRLTENALEEAPATVAASGGDEGSGTGAYTWPYTLTRSDTGAVIPNAVVWVTTDRTGVNIVATGITNAAGVVTLHLDAGTAYCWRSKGGYKFTNPQVQTVP